MPRDRVVLTREDESAEYKRIFRRGFIYVGIGALFDVAAVVLIFLENWAAGIVLAVIGILIGLYAGREFGRAGRTVETMRERGY